jgi:hypothetical protein
MKKLLILLLVVSFTSAGAQVKRHLRDNALISFFRIKGSVPDFKSIRRAPVFVNIPTNNAFTTTSYWQGASYTSYSENGRFRSTHSFDVQGVLRESRASFSLKKNGALSFWRVQFSPQRSRPHFIYTIH